MVIAAALAALLAGAAAAAPLEDEAAALVSTASLTAALKSVSTEPHVAGTKANERLADELEKTMIEAGLEVSSTRYDVLLSHPKRVDVTLVKPGPTKLARAEGQLLAEDERAAMTPADLMPWNAYSPSGVAEGEVVYASYARPEDYAALEAAGISLKGKIVLARYGKGYRGGKTLGAQKRGAAAIIFYSDPADDGWAQGDPMPKGPWGARDHFQRGANVYDFIRPGDPRKDESVLPTIPSVPLSYEDAEPILRALGGPHLPGFQGALPLTYHAGPGPAVVRLEVENVRKVLPIRNVVGRVRGAEEPEKLVIVSSHHDAWTRGAVDDGIGTAVMLELAKGFAKLARNGRRPRRSIVFASWDAEEYTLTGSTEWGEERADDLRKNAVAVLNLDAFKWGKDFTALGVPSLKGLLEDAAAKTPDPATGKSVLEAWRALPDSEYGAVGSGSDYTVFLNRLGVPAVETMFTGTAGVYHSIYDDADWVLRVDPELAYVGALARLNARMAARLADEALLPIDGAEYAATADRELDALKKAFPAHDVSAAKDAAARWKTAADAFKAAVSTGAVPGCVNARLMELERALLSDDGLPGRPWFRHVFYAPRPSYEALVLPGPREALEAGDLTRAAEQTKLLAAALDRAAAAQKAALDCLGGKR